MLRRLTTTLLAVAIIATACSSSGDTPGGSADSVEPGPGTALAPENTGNPGTLVAPTSTTEAPDYELAIAPTVAFLDACATEPHLVGPCHCASERLQHSFSATELEVFEDRLSGRNEFSPEVAATLVDCREATRPSPWAADSIDTYVTGCIKGSERLEDLCRCSTQRAQDVIPEARIGEYLAADVDDPSLVDLVNTCL